MNPSFLAQDTIAALATPPGEGAIGVIRLSGPDSIALASSFLELSPVPRQAKLAVFRQNGRRIDQVVATVYRGPASFTGEDMVEISCHGGTSVLRQVMGALVRAGVRSAERGEFSQRAFLNGKMDLLQAEAVADLISARTAGSGRAALSNLEGKLSGEVRAVRNALVEAAASLEVALDHSDDPTVGTALTFKEIGSRIEVQGQKIGRLLASYESGRLLKEGVKIAIAGRPNAGKSSLLNSLLSSDRAIVSPHPGTTRDTLEEGFDLLGIPAVLIDTAGLRAHTQDPVEEIGMERTRRAILESDMAVVVMDSASEISGDDERIAGLMNGKKAVVALNKGDRPAKTDLPRVRKLFPDRPLVSVSALKGEGMEELLQALRGQVQGIHGIEDPEGSEAVVTSLRHRDCLARAKESLDKAGDVIRQGGAEELAALEIREALESLGELTGESAEADILDKIFSGFCIGK